jgi:hypothetical protein
MCTRAVDPTDRKVTHHKAASRHCSPPVSRIRLVALPLEGTEDVLVRRSYGVHEGVSGGVVVDILRAPALGHRHDVTIRPSHSTLATTGYGAQTFSPVRKHARAQCRIKTQRFAEPPRRG